MRRQGLLGDIHRVYAAYLQEWADDGVSLIWRFDKKTAGSGTLGDLVAHSIDSVRFVTGQDLTEIGGAYLETVIKQRRVQAGGAGGGIAAKTEGAAEMADVTVDDSVAFIARLSGGALVTFEGARQAFGHQNRNMFEINGSLGSIGWDFENMNVLWYCDATAPPHLRGWQRIMCTHADDNPDFSHPYMGNWWPDAHVLGYDHTFTNQAADILHVLAGEEPVVPLATFADALKTQRVLAVVQLAAERKEAVSTTDMSIELDS